MNLSDDEKDLLQIQYQKKFMPLRKRFDQENERFYLNFDESQRMFLHKKRVEEFTKEVLNSRIQAFIKIYKRRKKGSQVPEDSDFAELIKEMQTFVEARIKEFSETHRNNIFSAVPDAIVEAGIRMISLELPSLITEAILPLSEFIFLTKTSESNDSLKEDEYEKALSIIKYTMLSQNSNPVSFKNDDEDSYRNSLLNSLNGNYKGQAVAEAFNKRGKTDILIRRGEERILIAECKIWGREKLSETINQLLNYVNWHDRKAAVIIFSNNVSFENVLSRIEEEVRKHEYYIESGERIGETFHLWFRHPEDENQKLFLSILAFNIYTSKKLVGKKQ